MAPERARRRRWPSAAAAGFLHSARDWSDGGLAVALAEAWFGTAEAARTDADQARAGGRPLAGVLGAAVRLAEADACERYARLFGEAPSRVLVSLAPESVARLQELAVEHGVPMRVIGTVTEVAVLRVAAAERTWLEVSVDDLYPAWAGTLAETMESS